LTVYTRSQYGFLFGKIFNIHGLRFMMQKNVVAGATGAEAALQFLPGAA
jgi:hypothetical protein